MSEEKKEIKFVDGLFVSRKETAPYFVKAELSFNQKFITWLQNNFNAKGWANVDILLSREGKLYAKLNDYKPNTETSNTTNNTNEINDIDEGINPEELPF